MATRCSSTADENGTFVAFDPGDTGLLTQVPTPEINFNGDRRLASVSRRERCSTCS